MMDKPFESVFGFIQVLPGAFSGYRWDALKWDEKNKESVLDNYLKTVLKDHAHKSLFEANMYLAEDRILCLKIYNKFGKRYTLRYIPTSEAVVDPVTNTIALLGQRRRWINGSWFALDYVLQEQQQNKVYATEHSAFEVMWFKISLYYAQYAKGNTYFILAIWFTIMNIMVKNICITIGAFISINMQYNQFLSVPSLVIFWYVTSVLVCCFLSICYSNKEPGVQGKYYAVQTFLGIIMLLAFGSMVAYVIIEFFVPKTQEELKDRPFSFPSILKWMTIGAIVANAIPILLNIKRAWEMFTAVPDYLYFSPTYIHLLIIYAFCRIDDLSWGTKGLADGDSNVAANAKWTKFTFVSKWLLANICLVVILAIAMVYQNANDIIILFFAFYFCFQVLCRLIGAIAFYIHFWGYFYWRMLSVARQNRVAHERDSEKIKEKLKDFFLDAAANQQAIDKNTNRKPGEEFSRIN